MTTLMKWLPFLAKFAGVSIPGAPIFMAIASAISAIFRGLAWFVRWLCADIADGLKEPQRFAVRLACFALVAGVSAYSGIQFKAERDETRIAKVEQQRDTVVAKNEQLKKEWKERDDADARRAADAKVARERAERDAREQVEREAAEQKAQREEGERSAWAAQPAAGAPVQRVRQRAAAPAKAEPGLLRGLPALLGFGK